MSTIKQIVDFSRDDQGRAAIIEVFMLVGNPQAHIDAVKALIKDGAIIQSVDSDTIRAVYRGTDQNKLVGLIDEGWSFAGQEEPPKCLCEFCKVPCDIRDTNGHEIDPEALSCQDQADKGLCGECIEPCDVRDGQVTEEDINYCEAALLQIVDYVRGGKLTEEAVYLLSAKIGKVRSEPTLPGKEAEREEILKASDMLFKMMDPHYGEPLPDEEEGFAAAKALLSIAYSDDEKKLSEIIAEMEKHPEERLKTMSELEARQIQLTRFMNALEARIDAYFGNGGA
jgi:hypothetical protein